MKLINPRIETLKELMALEEKRSSLQQDLDRLTEKLTQVQTRLLQGGSPVESKPAPKNPPKAVVKPRSKKSVTRRGELREKVHAALHAAGSTGVYVKELATALGTKPVNIHSWFHSALKTANSGIQKISGGHYRLYSSGSGKAGAKPVKPSASAKPAAVKPVTAKPAKGARKSVKRGELTAKILGALKQAGDKGISVSDLAAQLGAKYKNIYIWFATTGKKQTDLKKVGPARYKLS